MLVPLGYSQITALAAAKGLNQGTLGSLPPTANYAVVQAEGAPVRWRDDGTDPTSSLGMLLPEGGILEVSSRLAALQFIQATAGAILNIAFYKA